MILVMIFLIIVISFISIGGLIISPLTIYDTQVNNNFSSLTEKSGDVKNIKISSDFKDDNFSIKKEANFSKTSDSNEDINYQEEIQDKDYEGNMGLSSSFSIKKVKTNNIINSDIVNSNEFMIFLKVIPLEDFSELTFFTNDTVETISSEQYIFPIIDDDDGVDVGINDNTRTIKIDIKKRLKDILDIKNLREKDNIYGNIIGESSGLDGILKIEEIDNENEKYVEKIGGFFSKKIIIKSLYSINNEGNIDITKTKNNNEFEKGRLYIIKLYFKIKDGKANLFKLYIPGQKYLTLNNVQKNIELKQGKKYKINSIRIVKNSLINKISEIEVNK